MIGWYGIQWHCHVCAERYDWLVDQQWHCHVCAERYDWLVWHPMTLPCVCRAIWLVGKASNDATVCAERYDWLARHPMTPRCVVQRMYTFADLIYLHRSFHLVGLLLFYYCFARVSALQVQVRGDNLFIINFLAQWTFLFVSKGISVYVF